MPGGVRAEPEPCRAGRDAAGQGESGAAARLCLPDNPAGRREGAARQEAARQQPEGEEPQAGRGEGAAGVGGGSRAETLTWGGEPGAGGAGARGVWGEPRRPGALLWKARQAGLCSKCPLRNAAAGRAAWAR